MEGWLFLMKSNRFCMYNIRKRYFVLHDFYLKSFNSIPTSNNELPIGNAMIDSCIQVMDNGRKNIHNKAFFVFTVYLTSNQREQLKLGATSLEDASRWIHSLKDATIRNPCPHNGRSIAHFFDSKWQSSKMDNNPRRTQSSSSLDSSPYSSTCVDAFISHANATSSWKIINCDNGLRIFRESRRGIRHQLSSFHPTIMVVGVVDGMPEAIFDTLMSLHSSRSQWDFCFGKGAMIQRLDDHTDIIHIHLGKEWLPWGLQPRDLLVCRYWRKDDNGTYVVLFNSVIHKNCPPQSNYVRASLRDGGYIITPMNEGNRSVVRHVLSIDWKSWRSQFLPSVSRSITIIMLDTVAALRELFKEKSGSKSNDFHGELTRDIVIGDEESKAGDGIEAGLPSSLNIRQKDKNMMKDEAQTSTLGDESDRFFDVSDHRFGQSSEKELPSESSEVDNNVQDSQQHKKTTGGKQKLQDSSAQNVGESQVNYGSTLPLKSTSKCSCTTADPSLFMIRGKSYLRNQQKIKAQGTMMELAGADWLKSNKRQDDLARRPGCIVQKYAAQGGSEFFIVINMQVPGATTYNLALYYLTRDPLEGNQLLERFVNGDNAFRNSRFKLTPYISKGSWLVKQSVRKKPCLLCKALEVKYFQGKNYLELAVDVGSSKVARGIVNLVIGCVNNLVVELAFLIQGNTEEELPECLLGTCRLSYLDTAKAVVLP